MMHNKGNDKLTKNYLEKLKNYQKHAQKMSKEDKNYIIKMINEKKVFFDDLNTHEVWDVEDILDFAYETHKYY